LGSVTTLMPKLEQTANEINETALEKNNEGGRQEDEIWRVKKDPTMGGWKEGKKPGGKCGVLLCCRTRRDGTPS
jgi:hypothetical protein